MGKLFFYQNTPKQPIPCCSSLHTSKALFSICPFKEQIQFHNILCDLKATHNCVSPYLKKIKPHIRGTRKTLYCRIHLWQKNLSKKGYFYLPFLSRHYNLNVKKTSSAIYLSLFLNLIFIASCSIIIFHHPLKNQPI